MVYAPGREVEIAHRIAELSVLAKYVKVNLTGGEPLLAERFGEALKILAEANVATIQLISNLRLLPGMMDTLLKYAAKLNLQGSLHIKLRTEQELGDMVNALQKGRDRLHITLNQVDYNLSLNDRLRLAKIEKATGLRIRYQTYIPPRTAEGKVKDGDEISQRHFVPTRGRRCCLGYSHFLVNADGMIWSGLWCAPATTKKMALQDLNPQFLWEQGKAGMQPCPKESCGCNYNVFHYGEYLKACDSLGYPDGERMQRDNTRASQQRLRRWSQSVGDIMRLFMGPRKQSKGA
jgi:hypothetical protein